MSIVRKYLLSKKQNTNFVIKELIYAKQRVRLHQKSSSSNKLKQKISNPQRYYKCACRNKRIVKKRKMVMKQTWKTLCYNKHTVYVFLIVILIWSKWIFFPQRCNVKVTNVKSKRFHPSIHLNVDRSSDKATFFERFLFLLIPYMDKKL